MRIAVVGAGAMGSVYGGRLALAGHDVTLIDLRADHVAAINQHGLRLSGVNGEEVIRIPAVTDATGLAPAELVIVFVDANATQAAAATAARLLRPDGSVLTLQNGIGNVEALSAVLGAAGVVGGITLNSANLPAAGHADHSHEGPSWIGELDGRRSPRVEALAAQLAEAGFETIVTTDVLAQIWNKFLLNCAINPLSAITGLLPGEIAETRALDALQAKLVEEVIAVAQAKGIRLPDPDPLSTVRAHCRERFNRPSMLQHVEQGRRTEIDALNGALVREAAALGLLVPYNDAVARLVKGVEQRRMKATG